MPGLLFGIIDNGILLVGAFTGLSLERFLPRRFQSGFGAVVGAGFGNALSDLLAGIVDMGLTFGVGVFLGCLIPMIYLPIHARLKRR